MYTTTRPTYNWPHGVWNAKGELVMTVRITDNDPLHQANTVGRQIVLRLHWLLAIVGLGGLWIAAIGIVMVVSIIRASEHDNEDRRAIDERNIEVTVIVGECLRTTRDVPGIRECVRARLGELPPLP